MMLQNRFTGLYLLFDLSVGARDLNTGIQLRLPPSLFRCSKANLDRCSTEGGFKTEQGGLLILLQGILCGSLGLRDHYRVKTVRRTAVHLAGENRRPQLANDRRD